MMRILCLALALFCFACKLSGFTVHTIGDSHSCCSFLNIEGIQFHHQGPLTMHRVGRDGIKLINLKHIGINEGDVIVFSFGEIDVRCHIGKQRDLKGRSEDEILDRLVERYIQTILDNKKQFMSLHPVIFCVVPPSNNHFNPVFPYYGTIEDRISITKKLNLRLTQAARYNGIAVLDVYDDYSTPLGDLRLELSDGTIHIGGQHTQAVKRKLNALISSLGL